MKLTDKKDKFTLESTQQELKQLLDLVQIALTTKYLDQETATSAARIESLLRAGLEKKPSPATEESLSFNRKQLDQIRYEQPKLIYLDKIREQISVD